MYTDLFKITAGKWQYAINVITFYLLGWFLPSRFLIACNINLLFIVSMSLPVFVTAYFFCHNLTANTPFQCVILQVYVFWRIYSVFMIPFVVIM
jgi:hypothetical protein